MHVAADIMSYVKTGWDGCIMSYRHARAPEQPVTRCVPISSGVMSPPDDRVTPAHVNTSPSMPTLSKSDVDAISISFKPPYVKKSTPPGDTVKSPFPCGSNCVTGASVARKPLYLNISMFSRHSVVTCPVSCPAYSTSRVVSNASAVTWRIPSDGTRNCSSHINPDPSSTASIDLPIVRSSMPPKDQKRA
jgi:hypothetical protein